MARLEVAQINLPVVILIWLMIIPMLLKIDLRALSGVRRHWRAVGVTLFVNWGVKPFSMALLAWGFIRGLFADWLPADQIDSYTAGLILLAAAPCTAMVFVWCNLSHGEPHYTLSQVALNHIIMVFAFAPIVVLLLGLSAITVPRETLFLSVLLYIVRCRLWRAKRRPVVPGSREARLDTRRAVGAKGDPKIASERGVQSFGSWQRSGDELARL